MTLTSLGLDHRPLARLAQLYVGLVLFGFSLALLVRAELGLAPWDVFHQGVSNRTSLSLGTAAIVTSIVVLIAWIPLRERPGIGTISNAIVVGLSIDASLVILPDLDNLAIRIALLIGGVVLNAITIGMYVGAGLGPGSRDGLMTGLAKRGWSIRAVRTGIEVVVLAAGIALGGTFGVGTVIFAIAIGPLAQIFLPRFDLSPRVSPTTSS